MPNLVGIGNSQVPTNAMLGDLAYQNTNNLSIENVNIKNIGKLSGCLEPNTSMTDIFVYDTSRDSDGGAWRYRTQHTSWYNEPLGTTYRGTRKEFPSVAILVTHNSTQASAGEGIGFSIYDGDNPNFPLWMRFPISNYAQGSNWSAWFPGLGRANAFSYTPGVIHALNGQIVIGNSENTGHVACMANLISEKLIEVIHYGQATNQFYHRASNFSSRLEPMTADDSSSGDIYYSGDNHTTMSKSGISGRVVSGRCRDIDMFVENYTTLDDETGLPFPSIAFALEGGLSILRGHDRAVDDDTFGSYKIHKCNFGRKGDIGYIIRNNNVVQHYYSGLGNAGLGGTGQLDGGQVGDNNDNGSFYYHYNLSTNLNPTMGIVYSGYEDSRLVPNPYGEYADDLWLIPSSNGPLQFYLGSGRDHSSSSASSMGSKVHLIWKDAVTGYMPGDCRMAILGECANGNNNGFETGSATDGLHKISETLHYGNEFSINGDGSNTGFTYVSSSCSSGFLFLADVSSARATRNPGNTFLVSGRKYCLQYQRTGSSNNFVFDDDGAGAGQGSTTTYHSSNFQNTGTYAFVFTATGSNRLRIMRTQTGSGGNIQVEYIRIYDISDDEVDSAQNHSVYRLHASTKNFGFAVKGELTRKPVYPGSDLMCYSGFSSSNYLIRGADSANEDIFQWGTGDFMFIGWVFPAGNTSDNSPFIGHGDLFNNNGFLIDIDQHSAGYFLNVGYLGVNNSFASNNSLYPPLSGLQWNQFVVYMSGNTFRVYINGQLFGTTWTGSSINWSTRWGNGQGKASTVIGGRAGGVGNSSYAEWANSNTEFALLRAGLVPGHGSEGFTDEAIRIMYEDEKQLFRPGAKCCLGGTTSTPKAIDYDFSTDLLHVSTDTERAAFRRLVRINREARTNTLSYPKLSANGGVVAEIIQN